MSLTGVGLTAGVPEPAQAAPSAAQRFRYCLNTATLMGYKLPIAEQVEVAAKAGYSAIEPWLSDLRVYADGGGSLGDLRKRIADQGLTVESAIGFPEWMVDDPARRAKGLEEARREMDLVARIGGKRIAMPPAGPSNGVGIQLSAITERYRAVLEAGDRIGIVPELEFWGSSPHLSRLSQAVYVAMEANHPKACVLADVFHLYKGGSGFTGLKLVSGNALQVLHMNDDPSSPPQKTVQDSQRVFPGDGVAPLKQIVGDLGEVAPDLVLSLELFNASYWKHSPMDTAKSGLAKMQAVVRAARP